MNVQSICIAFVCYLRLAAAFQMSSMMGVKIHQIPSSTATTSFLRSTVLDREELKTKTSSSSSTTDLPPLLQNMANERREYEMKLGKAMDTLRKDYPNMLHKTPGTFPATLHVKLSIPH